MNFFNRPITTNSNEDDVLLKGYQRDGDLAVLGKLFEKYMHLVFGICLKYLKDEDQSKDAVMAIFEELVVKVKQHEIREFKSWLYVLSRNYCLMQLRAAKKVEIISLEGVMEFDMFLHPDETDTEVQKQILERCMSKLIRGQQQSIDLFYFGEKCYKEIVEITGFTLNEVKSYIQNGRRNLKICMEKNGEY